jgi:hypothetical protein
MSEFSLARKWPTEAPASFAGGGGTLISDDKTLTRLEHPNSDGGHGHFEGDIVGVYHGGLDADVGGHS